MSRRLALLLLLLLIATGCSGGGASQAGPDGSGGSAAEDGLAGDGEERVSAPDGIDGAAGDEGQEAGGTAASLPDIVPVSSGDRIIKDGEVSLEVAEGRFDTVFERLVVAADDLGGTVVATRTRTLREGRPAGTVTVRVPVDQYERLLVAVREYGTIRSRRITSQDVSTEYVDLQARLRQQQAQERFYLGLLERAEDVEDAIAVQQQLQGIQVEIERLRGRIQFLDDRTSYSTLTVEIFEPGAAPLVNAEGPITPSLARYWQHARAGLVRVIGTLLVAVTVLAPLWIPALIALVVWRALRRRAGTLVTPTE